MFDMFKALGKMGEIEERVKEARAELAEMEIKVVDAENQITVFISGDRQIKSIDISPEALNNTSAGDINKRLTDTINKGLEEAKDKAKNLMSERLKDHLPNIPGLDLSKFGLGV
jgi:nucleoid-associated protein EbfC